MFHRSCQTLPKRKEQIHIAFGVKTIRRGPCNDHELLGLCCIPTTWKQQQTLFLFSLRKQTHHRMACDSNNPASTKSCSYFDQIHIIFDEKKKDKQKQPKNLNDNSIRTNMIGQFQNPITVSINHLDYQTKRKSKTFNTEKNETTHLPCADQVHESRPS